MLVGECGGGGGEPSARVGPDHREQLGGISCPIRATLGAGTRLRWGEGGRKSHAEEEHMLTAFLPRAELLVTQLHLARGRALPRSGAGRREG